MKIKVKKILIVLDGVASVVIRKNCGRFNFANNTDQLN